MRHRHGIRRTRLVGEVTLRRERTIARLVFSGCVNGYTPQWEGLRVSFTVEDFTDLVRLLEQYPEWRAQLRRLLLSEELLTLPER
ncbi:MAG: hypothetical protein N2Z82_09365, partial [Thermomicrobium sp.]|nr:hypothetical protein [Thermomicrobium sp.]